MLPLSYRVLEYDRWLCDHFNPPAADRLRIARCEGVWRLRQQGLKLHEIGARMTPPVTKERVRQLLNYYSRILHAERRWWCREPWFPARFPTLICGPRRRSEKHQDPL